LGSSDRSHCEQSKKLPPASKFIDQNGEDLRPLIPLDAAYRRHGGALSSLALRSVSRHSR
jgi:hypothetical protein